MGPSAQPERGTDARPFPAPAVPRAPLALRVWTGLSVGIVLDVDEVSPPPTTQTPAMSARRSPPQLRTARTAPTPPSLSSRCSPRQLPTAPTPRTSAMNATQRALALSCSSVLCIHRADLCYHL